MTDDLNGSPAGDADTTPVAMTIDAAAERLAGLDERPETPEEPATEQAPEETGEGEPEEASSDDASDEEAAPQDEQSDPGSDDDDEIIHGNKLVRLRDGRTIRVGELKKLVDREPEFQRQEAEIKQREQQYAVLQQQIQAEQARIAQAAQFFQQAVPMVLQKAQQDIPPPVPEEMWDTDPIEAMRLDRVRARKIGEFQQLQHQAATYQQQQQAQLAQQAEQAKQAQTHQYREYVQRELDTLVKEMPELSNPEKANAFHGKVVKGAEVIGFTADDLQTVADRRVLRGLAMIAEYEALRSQRPAVQQKVADKPPVKAPGRRVSDAEQQAASRKEVIQRARANGGRLEDVAAAIAALDL